MPKFKSNNTNLFYQITGKGIPIIFTHGASWNHSQWNNQVKYFKNKYQVITWDVRGHGYSSLPSGIVKPEDFSADFIALMDYLDIEKAIFCGFSMGGHISLQTAIRYPNRVKGLILIGTPCSYSFNLYQKTLVPLTRFLSKMLPVKTSAKIQAKMLSKITPSNYHYIYQAFSLISHDNWNRIWSAITQMENKYDLHKVLCPTLLLIGDHDNLTNYQQPYMHKHILGSRLEVIPNAQHGTNLDNPDAVNLSMQRFLMDINN